MPGRQWYALALLLVLAGAGFAGLTVYSRLNGLAAHLPQIIVPGEADLTLSRAGTYTIYLEREAVVGGRVYSTGDAIEGLQVRITSVAGSSVEMSAPTVSSNYAIGGRSGNAVLAFSVVEPGRYQFAASYPDGRIEPQGVVAIGLGVPQKIFTAILQALAVAGIGFVLGVIVAIVTFVKRRRTAARQLTVSAPGPAAMS